jgi:transcriptional regulator with XRE-family HTH domain
MSNERTNNREIAHRICIARLALGLTEQQAAERTGMSLQSYQRLEAVGTQQFEPLRTIAHAFNASIDWIADGWQRPTALHAPVRHVAILPIRELRQRQAKPRRKNGAARHHRAALLFIGRN